MIRLRVAVLWSSALVVSLVVVAVATMAGLIGIGQYGDDYCFAETHAPADATAARGPHIDWPNHLTCDYYAAGTRTFTDYTIPVGLAVIAFLALAALAIVGWVTYRLTRHSTRDSSRCDPSEGSGDGTSRDGVRPC
jgi:hypothetical protein